MVEDWIWDGPEDLPGCGVTLALLYYFVPATEEVDLLDELERDRRTAAWTACYSEFASVEDGNYDAGRDEDDQADDMDDATTAPMSLGQILGMLEHVLGAEVIDESKEDGVEDV